MGDADDEGVDVASGDCDTDNVGVDDAAAVADRDRLREGVRDPELDDDALALGVCERDGVAVLLTDGDALLVGVTLREAALVADGVAERVTVNE